MKKGLFVLIAVAIFCNTPKVPAEEQGWAGAVSSVNDTNFACVEADPNKPNVIYAAAVNGVYKTSDTGKVWRQIFISTGSYKGINRVYVSKDGGIFIAARNGLFASYDGGQTWRRLFRGMGAENDIRSIAQHPIKTEIFLIGAGNGLFVTENSGRTWRKNLKYVNELPVRSIVMSPANPDVIYACTDKTIYKTCDAGKNWKKILSSLALKEENNAEGATPPDTEDEQEAYGTVFNCIAMRGNYIYLGTDKGIFYSRDSEISWEKFNDTGLTNTFINFILLSNIDKTIFAATKKGAFRFSVEDNKWHQIYAGMTSLAVNYAAFDSEGENFLWLAAEKGIYRAHPKGDNANFYEIKNEKDIYALFEREPDILRIQDAAIRYAEVHPDKIRKWRRGAKFKAILPKVTFGIDQSKSDTYEIYTSSSKNYSVIGPEDYTEGWDLTFTWDLSDLIWNESQTSIDVRSKLMVQLRDDIVDEVTRYYYERRRLQVDLAMNPPQDLPLKMEKELRLQELTAYIDGLTGGYLSKELGRK